MLQRGSRHNGECYQLPDGPAADERDAKLRRLPEDLAWIHGYDAETALATSTGSHHDELVRTQPPAHHADAPRHR
jgi:salicylate hydroxylase